MNYSRNHIGMKIHDHDVGTWRLTCFYSFPERYHQRDSWNLILNLSLSSTLPWCLIGDFNDLHQDNKRGLVEHPNWLFL